MKPGENEFYIDGDELYLSLLFYAFLRGIIRITLQRRHGILIERGNDYPQHYSNLLLHHMIVYFVFFDPWVAWDGAVAHYRARQVQHAGIPKKGEIV